MSGNQLSWASLFSPRLHHYDNGDRNKNHERSQYWCQQNRIELHKEESPQGSKQGYDEKYPAIREVQASIHEP